MHRKIYHMSRPVYREFDWLANRFLYIPHTHTNIYLHIYTCSYAHLFCIMSNICINFSISQEGSPSKCNLRPGKLCGHCAVLQLASLLPPLASLPARISAHCNALIMIIILEALISIWYSVGTFGLPFAPANYSNMQTAQHLPSVVAVVVAVPSVVALVVVHAAVAVAVCSCSCRCQAAT